jgi:protein-L-isoaspartate O-methyltransferase
MGGSVSSGRSNDELVDNLIESGLIKSNSVERVFRAVDRGIFYLPNYKAYAYRDLAWREGHIHISAPCIYTRVLESLEVRPNQSFLNIGSGTGYFSTMVGLILGPYGINHNIELHDELIEYAKEKLYEFVKTAVHFDDFDFCLPKFVLGNFLNLNQNQDDMILYDRIYVGAGVNDEHEEFVKSLLKIDGILIMPLNDCVCGINIY